MSRHRAAFTLVEISVVLVIVGLLIGGVLTGQTLIHSSQLKAATSEYQRYVTAIGTFRDKYYALPGDMPNAISFWGMQAGFAHEGADGTCAAVTTASVDTRTCNGDGNSMIASYAPGSEAYEMYRAWQHLSNAALIEGSFSGIRDSARYSVPGWNVPISRLNKAGWGMRFFGTLSGDSAFFDGNYGHVLTFSGVAATSYGTAPVLLPEDAANLDAKLDDGRPSSGTITSTKNTFRANCVNADGAYNVTNQRIADCMLVFVTGY